VSRRVYRVDVGRVIVSGVSPATMAGLDRATLQALVERAVTDRLASAALFEGRAARATMQVTDRTVSTGGAGAVAAAVAAQVAHAATGGARRG
jgi:hypothetical protein